MYWNRQEYQKSKFVYGFKQRNIWVLFCGELDANGRSHWHVFRQLRVSLLECLQAGIEEAGTKVLRRQSRDFCTC